ncbi:MAG: hypothetical protein EOO41_05655 [Methanobacteriota archaeon]|nr:MAG: hypothetical protein EOO41_05655 [Euryarchaeota archaeon]
MQEKEGFDSTAALCALQRANNHPGKTREYLDSKIIRDLFKGSSLERDLALLRETLSEAELAAVLEGRSFGRRKKLGLEDLDYSSVRCPLPARVRDVLRARARAATVALTRQCATRVHRCRC